MKQKLRLLLFLSALITVSASAQIGKGHYYIGGSLGYDYNSYGTSSTINFPTGYTNYSTTGISDFRINPEFGFFLGNKWSIGIQPEYTHSSGTETSNFYSNTSTVNSYTYSDKYHNSSIGIGINLRYYCMFSDKFGFFPQFGISTLNNATYTKYGTLSVGGSPNIVFFPSPKVGINMGFGQVGYNLDYQTRYSSFSLGVNNGFTFGLNYYWGKK